VLLDTPFGFQANADDLVTKATEYFRVSVGADLGLASWRSAADADALATGRALARLREAHYVFSGPGSPSYALRQWAGSPIPGALADRLATGGCVTFASAAALTLGVATVPVYEIYKVGAAPEWLEGLDLLAPLGLQAAVIPHYDNAEGGTHDTRFCYLGEPRLARLELELPEGAFVLGVDEHTALVLDLDEGSATVSGRGGVTVRRAGRSEVFAAGTTVAVADLAFAASGAGRRAATASTPETVATDPPAATGVSPLLEQVRALDDAFAAALAARDVDAAVVAMLELDATLVDWSRDSLQSDELDRGRAVLRSMVVRLGELARTGARDPAAVVGPFVDAVVEARTRAREARDWTTADALRDRLAEAGVELRDAGDGTDWVLRDGG
jgi:cyanophycinase-like exopeptidase